jgi:hypothetical protein
MLALLAALASAAEGPAHLTLVGGGAVIGGMLGPTQLTLGFSPSFLAAYEYGRGGARVYFAGRTAPTFLWVAGNEAIGGELAFADLGFTVGSERMRMGAFGTAGLLGAGAGVRAVFTPFDTKKGDLRGLEARLTVFAPRAGNFGLYYVHAFLPRRDEWIAREGEGRGCARFALAVGGAATVSSTARSWEFVGSDGTAEVSGSPAVAVACETGRRGAGFVISGESAPFAYYRVPTVDGGADRTLHHMGSLTLGAWFGGDGFRAGPVATAGVWALGGGVRAVLTTTAPGDGTHHGVEVRAIAMVPSAPAGEVMALYHVWFGK